MNKPSKPQYFEVEQAPAQHFEQPKTFNSTEVSALTPEETSNTQAESGLSQALSGTKTRVSRLTKLFLCVLVALLLLHSVDVLLQAWQQSPWRFGLYAAFCGLGLTLLGRFGWREFRKLRQLKRLESSRSAAQRMQATNQQGEAQVWLSQQALSMRYPQALEQFNQWYKPHHNDAQTLALYEDSVVRSADKEAQQLVAKYSGEAAVLLAASPLAVLDMGLILWRNQRMINDVAMAYSVELGYWSRLRLVKGIVQNILYAGATEMATELGSQFLSVELSGKLSARVAQGLGGGLLTARLGHKAMTLCRPLPFTKENSPKLATTQKMLLAKLADLSKQTLSGKGSIRTNEQEQAAVFRDENNQM
ncbi:TIGR01620 family protein [Paraferrimonas haliotis]|uniref:TIGR01620 family protein n=1 Tax=Paraferrimonas haliotis TaxID=2013866 RepID=A0AA37WXB9_9GAMM|nr:TIGR01620 family protein [Paraferrimonas haliotis]GLS84212.1 hypothetical protein GCM10007894_21890 [Paraferrimonas haliotis]